MFEWLSRFNKILVTGPQRSGSRTCAKMIAYDTGHEYIDENDLGMDSLYGLCSFIDGNRKVVIQCPVLCRYVHMLGIDDIAIVMMRRNVQDIMASQKRINWNWEWLELARYDRSDGIIAEVKYQFWDQHQKDHIKYAFEVEYEQLAAHPLWLGKELRHDFSPIQTNHPAQTITLNENALPIASAGIHLFEKMDNNSAILAKKDARIRLINDTGRFIWTLCDGKHTRQDILQALQKEFNGVRKDELSSDLDVFLSDLVFDGYLRITAFDNSADDSDK
jgi:hypothetical protein